MKLLSAMGKERDKDLLICCHGSIEHGEWLLDVIWMVPNEHKVILAVESEWGRLALVEDDFDKLLSVKAPRKLMLFSTRNHQSADKIVEKLASNMRAYPYHVKGEEYMLLEITAPGAFRYCFKVQNDGPQEDIIFESAGPPLPWRWQTAFGTSATA